MAVFLVTGCASNEVRVTEYGSSFFTGGVGGCRVTSEGNLPVKVTYKGEKCSVTTETEKKEN